MKIPNSFSADPELIDWAHNYANETQRNFSQVVCYALELLRKDDDAKKMRQHYEQLARPARPADYDRSDR